MFFDHVFKIFDHGWKNFNDHILKMLIISNLIMFSKELIMFLEN